MSWHHLDDNGKLVLSLYIQPGAKNTRFSGLHGNALKVSLSVQPIEGKANKALIRFLADCFQVAVNKVSIKRGAKSRYKLVEIEQSTIDPDSFLKEEHC